MQVSEYSEWQLRQLMKEDLISYVVCKLQRIIDEPNGYIDECDESRIQNVINVLKDSNCIGGVNVFSVTDMFNGSVQLDESKIYIIRRT